MTYIVSASYLTTKYTCAFSFREKLMLCKQDRTILVHTAVNNLNDLSQRILNFWTTLQSKISLLVIIQMPLVALVINSVNKVILKNKWHWESTSVLCTHHLLSGTFGIMWGTRILVMVGNWLIHSVGHFQQPWSASISSIREWCGMRRVSNALIVTTLC